MLNTAPNFPKSDTNKYLNLDRDFLLKSDLPVPGRLRQPIVANEALDSEHEDLPSRPYSVSND